MQRFLLLVLLLVFGNAACADRVDIKAQARVSADYILKCQLSDGLIAMNPEQDIRGVPYFANFSAMGLLRAYQLTKDKRYLSAVLRYADWYISHMNPDGTTYDYSGTRELPKATNTYDSTDSYAATFIWLCYETYYVTKDTTWLKRIYPSMDKCVGAIKLTWQDDGLTYATPKYPVKYLMDNIEVRLGLRSAVELARLCNDKAQLKEWKLILEQNRVGIRKLWLKSDNRFAYAMVNDGSLEKGMDVWYPGGMANAMALVYIMSPKDPAAKILGKELVRKFPEASDYWMFVVADKFGHKLEAVNTRDKMKASLTNSLDHAHYIRSLMPERERFAYLGEYLAMP